MCFYSCKIVINEDLSDLCNSFGLTNDFKVFFSVTSVLELESAESEW